MDYMIEKALGENLHSCRGMPACATCAKCATCAAWRVCWRRVVNQPVPPRRLKSFTQCQGPALLAVEDDALDEKMWISSAGL